MNYNEFINALLRSGLEKSCPTSRNSTELRQNSFVTSAQRLLYIHKLRTSFIKCEDLCDELGRGAVNLKKIDFEEFDSSIFSRSYQRKRLFSDFYKHVILTFDELCNLPNMYGEEGLKGGYAEFQVWAEVKFGSGSKKSDIVNGWRPFIDTINMIYDALTNNLDNAELQFGPVIGSLASASLSVNGWDGTTANSHMHKTASLCVEQLRVLLSIVVPEVFNADEW